MKLNKQEKEMIIPVLDGNFHVQVKDFHFENHEPNPELDAEISIDSDPHAFLLKLRARNAKDLPQYKSDTGEKRVEETMSGSAVYDGSTHIVLKNIWPVHNSTNQVVGPGFSERWFHFNSIEITTNPSNIFDDLGMAKALLDKIESAGGVPDERLRVDVPSETGSLKVFAVSYFSNVNLRYRNTGVSESEYHPFWGEKSRSQTISWDGELLGYRFSACQIGNHLKLGVEGESVSGKKFFDFFKCFSHAFAFIHQINPWHTYQEVRVNGKAIKRTLAPVYQTQGRLNIFWERHALRSEINPDILLECLTKWFLCLTPKEFLQYERLLHNFQGSDNTLLPFDSQLLGVCTTVEGLVNKLPKPEASESFTEIKNLVLEVIENRCRKTGGAHQDIWRRLKGFINNWTFASRRERWDYSLNDLIPEESEHIQHCYKLFDKLRNPLAHGSSSSIATIENLGLLAGLVNCILLSLAGYTGKCLKSPFDENLINIYRSEKSDE